MKLSYVVVAAAVAAAVFAFFKIGHAAHKTTQSIGTSLIAIPGQAASVVAQQDVQIALPALAQYYTDHGTYAGASAATLTAYNVGLPRTLVVVGASAASFCVEDTVDGGTAHATSTSGPVVAGPCP
jgi:hypothetical protein